VYSNVRDTSLCLGRGGYLMFNSFLALIVFLRRHPQQIPPVVDFSSIPDFGSKAESWCAWS